MAIQQGQCTIFKKNCLSGLENFAVGTPYTYKIALYTSFATIGPDTLVYTTDNELPTGSGYTATGKVLTVIPPTTDSQTQTAYISFANVTWDPASFTTRGALIYNSNTGAAVCVLNFGSDKVATSTFTIQFPTADATNAILRVS